MKESSLPDVLHLTFPALVCFIVAELEAGRVHEHDDFLFVRFWCAPFPRHLKHICPEIFLDTFYLARYAWHEAALEKAAKQG